MKFGAIPTNRLPKKSHEAVIHTPRRVIQKHLAITSNPKPFMYNNIDDIISAYNSLTSKICRLNRVNSKKLHMTYYQNSDLHATATISLLIKHLGEMEFSFSCAFCGVYAQGISNSLSLNSQPLSSFLNSLLRYNPCMGYKSVVHIEDWNQKLTPSFSDDGVISLAVSYISKQCEAAAIESVKPCNTCMKLHIHEEDAEKRKCRRLEKLKDIPLADRSTLANTSIERLRTTVAVNRKHIAHLENELRVDGVTVSDCMSPMLESFSDDPLLKDWWTVQKQIQNSDSKYGRRYPPSVVRSVPV